MVMEFVSMVDKSLSALASADCKCCIFLSVKKFLWNIVGELMNMCVVFLVIFVVFVMVLLLFLNVVKYLIMYENNFFSRFFNFRSKSTYNFNILCCVLILLFYVLVLFVCVMSMGNICFCFVVM